jgi:glycerate 2-kinase
LASTLSGDARSAGVRIAAALVQERDASVNSPARCVIWGGETTMTLPDSPPPGGRCQALALSAARTLRDAGERARGITLLAAGTDGRDGTTSAAGAIVDASTAEAMLAAGVDPAGALERHDAHGALAAAHALFAPGPTGTNVMDVVLALVEPRELH